MLSAKAQWKAFMTPTPYTEDNEKQPKDAILSEKNELENKPWGDVRSKKEDQITRIYSINLNGLQLDSAGGKFDSVCRAIKLAQVDIFCGQEHNVDTMKSSVRSIIFQTAKAHWDRHRVAFSTSPIEFHTAFKPGGTLVMAVDSVTGRLCHQEKDKWGRWTSQVFQGQGERKIAIISAYQPIVKGGKAGKTTVAAQHMSLLIQAQDTVTDPRQAFRRDLSAWLLDYKTKGYEILLVGDFNEPLGSDADGMSKLAGDFDLLDVMASRNPEKPPATYARGSTRLDYALASESICNSLQYAGYDAFNSTGFNTDHRGFYMDFRSAEFFGSNTQQLVDRNKRELVSKNRRHVTAYLRKRYDLLEKCNAFSRAEKLKLPGNRHRHAERLDCDIRDASLNAERALPKCYEPAWSVEIAQAREKKVILSKQLTAFKSRIDHRAVIADDLSRLQDCNFFVPTTPQACSKALRVLDKELKEMVANSTERRDDELKRKLKALDESMASSDKNSAIELRKLQKSEDIKQLFDKLARMTDNQDRRGVARIEIPRKAGEDPKECTDWVQIDVPTEVLFHLQQRNRTHFGQASGTPFTVEPLSTDLGFGGDTKYGQQILDGTYDGSNQSSSVQRLLKHMQQVEEIMANPTRPTITLSELEGKIRVWKESTTTSPSGLHLGHLKALLARHSFSDSGEDEDDLSEEFKAQRDELNSKQKEMLELQLTMLNYALERGYSYVRWQTIANTILFKDSDNNRIHRTRVIHIYESDYNLVLGIKWREAMQKAEAARSLNDGQYGSRAKRSAPDPVFIEELQCEISRATRKPLILVNYDAMACYDRIPMNVASIISRKFGVPPEIVRLNSTTLEQAEYRLRTELGLAPTGYKHDSEYPIHGSGQGSANSPGIWCMLSSALLDGYDEVAVPATYQGTNNGTMVSVSMVSFVDDCNGQTNKFSSDGSPATLLDLVDQTKQNAQAWCDLLSASGGALEPSKCSCHIFQWKFTPQGAPVLVPDQSHHQSALCVMDKQSNKAISLKILGSFEAHATLGHHKAPMGNQFEQARQLQAKSDDKTSFLWTCPLSRLEAWTYYYACYLPSVGYPLACSSLTKSQLDQIQRKAMSILVARCGYNRNTRKEVLYGPLNLGGANFRHLYDQQGVSQVTMFIRHWRLNSTAGKLLRVALSWFQAQTGVSFPLLERTTTPLPQLESKWIASLRTFLSVTGMQLKVDTPSIAPSQRVNDHHIMDIIMESDKFTNAEIRRLNYCRLYLQATTMADLTDIAGLALDLSKWKGTPSLASSSTHGLVIHQDLPAEREWTLWRRMCKLVLSDNKGILKLPLGPWILPLHEQRQQHQAYYVHDKLCFSDTVLWVRMPSSKEYMRCTPTASGTVFQLTHQTRQWENLPTLAAPCMVEFVRDDLWNLQQISEMKIPHEVRASATFEQFVETLPPWESELLRLVELAEDPYTVSDTLQHGIRAVSDGSVWSDNQGAYGWIISTDQGDRVARGMGPACGASVDSYRAEAYGMLTILVFLRRLAEFTTQVQPWTGILATDSKSLLDTITDKPPKGSQEPPFGRRKPIQHLDVKCPEWDLLSSIITELQRWPEISLKHVRGHQDRTTAYSRLSLLSQLNVDADMMANTFQCDHGRSRTEVLLTGTAGVHLIAPNGCITKNYEAGIRYQATHPGLSKHIQERYGWSAQVMANVNWSAHGSSLRKQLKRKTHYTKLVHGIVPTCKQVHRKDPVRNKCPLCRDAVEDWRHILTCSHASRETWRTQLMTTLADKCYSLHTRPILTVVMCDGINGWLAHTLTAYPYHLKTAMYPVEVRDLIHRQNSIGWQQLFLGRFCNEWADIQDTHYVNKAAEARESETDAERQKNKKTNRTRTGQRWQVTIIGILWDQWWTLWTSRNKDLHGVDEKAKAEADTREAHRKLRELYDLRARLSPEVQATMFADLREHYEKPTYAINNWIKIHEPLIKQDLKRISARIKAGIHSIRQFMVVSAQ